MASSLEELERRLAASDRALEWGWETQAFTHMPHLHGQCCPLRRGAGDVIDPWDRFALKWEGPAWRG